MTERTRRSILLDEIQSTLIVRIVQLGFKESTQRHLSKRETRSIFPFGNFLRPRANGFDLIEIQLASRNRAMFVINFGIIPSENITLPWGTFHASEITTTVLDKNGRAYASSYLPLWFGIGKLWPNPLARAKTIVQRSLAALDDVEEWFSTAKLSSRLKMFENLTPTVSTSGNPKI